LCTLQCAAESWDRKEQAREALIEHGLSYPDAKAMLGARPEVAIERDAWAAYLRAMKELALGHVVPPTRPWRVWRHLGAVVEDAPAMTPAECARPDRLSVNGSAVTVGQAVQGIYGALIRCQRELHLQRQRIESSW
jgi:hypothetical protein